MSEIIILGAGQQGRICKTLAEENGHHVVAFVDDYVSGKVENLEVYRKIEDVAHYENYHYFVAIGEIEPRKKFCDEIKRLGLKSLNLIHKTASVEEGAVIGTGNFIYKFASVYGTATVGDNNIINCKAVIATDAVIGNNSNISMGCNICGGVEVGDNCYIGCNASAVSGVRIGSNVIVGAGSVVLEDVKDGEFVAGLPATRKEGKSH